MYARAQDAAKCAEWCEQDEECWFHQLSIGEDGEQTCTGFVTATMVTVDADKADLEWAVGQCSQVEVGGGAQELQLKPGHFVMEVDTLNRMEDKETVMVCCVFSFCFWLLPTLLQVLLVPPNDHLNNSLNN